MRHTCSDHSGYGTIFVRRNIRYTTVYTLYAGDVQECRDVIAGASTKDVTKQTHGGVATMSVQQIAALDNGDAKKVDHDSCQACDALTVMMQ